jgi:hypothetical protein
LLPSRALTLCDYQSDSAMMGTTATFYKAARMFGKKHEFHLELKDYTPTSLAGS